MEWKEYLLISIQLEHFTSPSFAKRRLEYIATKKFPHEHLHHQTSNNELSFSVLIGRKTSIAVNLLLSESPMTISFILSPRFFLISTLYYFHFQKISVTESEYTKNRNNIKLSITHHFYSQVDLYTTLKFPTLRNGWYNLDIKQVENG